MFVSVLYNILPSVHITVDPRLPRAPPGNPSSLLTRLYESTRSRCCIRSWPKGMGKASSSKRRFICARARPSWTPLRRSQYAVILMNDTWGFDLCQLFIKDFLWMYSIATRKARKDPASSLRQSRYPSTTAMDTNTPYFFRVPEFVFVTQPSANKIVLGIVPSVVRGTWSRQQHSHRFE